MIQIIKSLLLKMVDDIDAGNSNLSEEECIDVIRTLKRYTRTDTRFSKMSACKYLNISRSAFDLYVRNGFISKGHKEVGFKELHWTKKELDKFIKLRRKNNG